MEAQRLDLQVRMLQLELERVKAEAVKLRKRLAENGRHPRRIQQAVDDALLLAMVKVAGIHPSRRLAASLGLSQSRWEHAVALLKMARVITRSHHWEVSDLETIERKVTAAKVKAESDKQLFFLRHSRHRRTW